MSEVTTTVGDVLKLTYANDVSAVLVGDLWVGGGGPGGVPDTGQRFALAMSDEPWAIFPLQGATGVWGDPGAITMQGELYVSYPRTI